MENSFTKPYSEKTAQVIDKEISGIIEFQYNRACDILKKNKSKLKQLAERLLEKEVIFKDDLFNILGERPFEKKNKEIDLDGKDIKVAIN
jgi:cell division protease FtsH